MIRTLILGAGAAGLMAATRAGPGTLVIDHARAPGEKIRISGGGRCNFTNIRTEPENFLSDNPHFAKSALARYSPWDFVALVERHGIAWHEKTLGQLFCDGKATQIVAMLLAEAAKSGAEVRLRTELVELTATESGFRAVIEHEGRRQVLTPTSVIVATGGKSIPKMGASGLAYWLGEQFGHDIVTPRPGLVPFTFADARFAEMSGTAVPVRASTGGVSFDEAALFTHRGLSGPAILQISSFWQQGEEIALDLDPDATLVANLRAARKSEGRKAVSTVLGYHLPEKLVRHIAEETASMRIADQSDTALDALCDRLRDWRMIPGGTEGYRTAEVTAGGIATHAISSKTMESAHQRGLFFIGEGVDVTGWLGGYNFQWAWASGVAAGEAAAAR